MVENNSSLDVLGVLFFLILVVGSFADLSSALVEIDILLLKRGVYISVLATVLLLIYVLYPSTSS